MAIRAIIFDFNGVIADDETPHFLCFQQALREDGLSLTKEDYYGTYLGMDERNCLALLLNVGSEPDRASQERIHRILDRKALLFREHTAQYKPQLFPGVVKFVKEAGKRYRLAIASGGKREQIDYALRNTPIENDFAVIVSAEDCPIGKPDPAIYHLTLARLNRLIEHETPVTANECLVIEDSRAGIRSALVAGMRVVAVATSYPAEQLREAHRIIQGLTELSSERL